MKLKKYALICYILAFAMLLPLGSFAADDKDAPYAAPAYPSPYIDRTGGEYLELSYEFEEGMLFNIIVTDTRTGKRWESNPAFSNPEVPADNTKERAQLFVSYRFDANGNAENLKKIGYVAGASILIGEYDSYKDAVVKQQVEIEEIGENAIKVTYLVGSSGATLFPKAITKERMEFFLDKIEDEYERQATEDAYDKISYDLLRDQTIVDAERELRTANVTDEKEIQKHIDAKLKEFEKSWEDRVDKLPILEDKTAVVYTIKPEEIKYEYQQIELRNRWLDIGYSRSEYELDIAETGYIDESGTLGFEIPVIYKIEGNTFVAEVCIEETVIPPEVAITRIDVLPYFGAADIDAEEGYMLVPDGSGAIINLNNKDKRQTNLQFYVMDVNMDEALSRLSIRDISNIPYAADVILPVFGMKQGDEGFFAVIEQGYELSGINAYVTDDQNFYNTVYPNFFPTANDQIFYSTSTTTSTGGDGVAKALPKVDKEETALVRDKETKEMKEVKVTNSYARLPETNFVIRYAFLNGEAATYSGMAAYFRNYLVETYGLERLEAEADIPFYTDIYGTIYKKKNYVGIPMTVKHALTTMDEAETIVEALMERGVANMNLRYLGIANGGLRANFSNKFKPEGVLGGKSGYKDFLSAMDALGVSVFPDLDITHVYKDNMFDGFAPSDDTVLTMGRQEAIVMDLNVATGVRDDTMDAEYYHPRWIVKPLLYDKIFARVKKDMDAYGTKTASFGSVGSALSSDYEKDAIIDRTQTARIVAEQMRTYKEDGYRLVSETGFYHVLPYLSGVVNIPMTSSKFMMIAYEIPFVQMAIHGYIEYTGEHINVAQNNRYTIMKALEYGASVGGRFMYEQNVELQGTYYVNYYSMNYETWLDDVGEVYSAVNAGLADVQDQLIVKHECIGDDVFRTVYENGKTVICNYSLYPFEIAELGRTVGSYDYIIIEGGN